ncbi:MAG: hypothetical protein ACR2PR_08780 [Pseudohongiellaceae bacterium]
MVNLTDEVILQPPEPVITAERHYTPEMLECISKVFGERGRNLALSKPCQITIKGPSRTFCNFATKEVRTVMNNKDWIHSVPAVIHEFAHRYVNVFFMDIAVDAPNENHEACAIFAELVLAQECPHHGLQVMERMSIIREHPYAYYRKAVLVVDYELQRNAKGHIHAMMRRLINARTH